MTDLVTVVIPVSQSHWETGIYQEAVQSAERQTVRCNVVVQRDQARRGAAWARNQAMARVTSLFVVYLDADDLLDPLFVENTLRYYQHGRYVYTDWRLHGRVVHTPDTLAMLTVGQQHITPTLLPVAAWRAVGGFDETLSALEDEDFYRKLHATCWRGVRCPVPLVTYRREKGRSAVNQDTQDLDVVQQRVGALHALFSQRYERYKTVCGCIDTPNEKATANQPQPNDVLALALYSPMSKYGPVTGRKYPRAGLKSPLWVDVDDAQARPEWWQVIGRQPDSIAPDVQTVQRLAREALKPAPEPKPDSKKRRKSGSRRAAAQPA